jgi:hypothetical protein
MMSGDDNYSLLEDATFIFFDNVLAELRIDTGRLAHEYGVEAFEFYSWDMEKDELVTVTEREFWLYRKLRNRFCNGCTCKQFEPIYERFDVEIGVARMTSADGSWLPSDDEFDAAQPIDPIWDIDDYEEMARKNRLTAQLFTAILDAHGLSHITTPPRSGAHFIKGWVHPFSGDWYDAECLDLLGSGASEETGDISDFAVKLTKAYRLGRARSDQIWRQKHFNTSQSGAKQARNLMTATRKKSDGASKRAKEKLHAITKLWMLLCEGDPLLSRNDSKAADAIFDYLGSNLGDHSLRSLRIKKTGAPIGQDAIRKHLKELRTANKI